MTRLDRLILSELIAPFLGAALLFTGLFFAGGELVRFAEFLQKGESVRVVLQLFLLSVPGVMAYTFPMAMLLATLLGFGRLSSDSEVVAFTAAGCSFERAIVPVAVMGFIVSLIGVWFNNSIVPSASRGRNVIIDNYKAKGGNVTGARITVPLRDKQGNLTTLIHVEGNADLGSGELTNVSITQWEKGRQVAVFFAPRAVWETGTKNWKLYDFDVANWYKSGASIAHATTGETREVVLDTPDQLKAYSSGRPEDKDTGELREASKVLRKGENIDRAREFEVEVARRTSLPFAAFTFGLVGAALGVRPPREGKGIGFGLSVIVTFLYYVCLNVVSIIARNGGLNADLALMLPNLIGLVIAIFLIRRVMR
jgi:lipopolysaccharide export system permease protein